MMKCDICGEVLPNEAIQKRENLDVCHVCVIDGAKRAYAREKPTPRQQAFDELEDITLSMSFL